MTRPVMTVISISTASPLSFKKCAEICRRAGPRCLQGLVNHSSPFCAHPPPLLLLLIERAQRIEIEEGHARLDARTGKDRDARLPVVVFVGVGVALPTAAHGVHDQS